MGQTRKPVFKTVYSSITGRGNKGSESISESVSKPRPISPELKVCGDCNLCCKVYDIEDLEKKAGHLCHHASPSPAGGCSIWGLHPKLCQEFKCMWLKHSDMNGLWRPDTAGFVLRLDIDGTTLNIDTDPDRPYAWQKPYYYDQLKLWSEAMRTQTGLLVVHMVGQICVITPEEDLYLKGPKRGDILETGYENSLFGLRPFARVIPAKSIKKNRRA